VTLLRLQDVQVKYGNILVLHGINLTVGKGEIVSILGANGAGKSTTLMSISGLIRPFRGEILLEDQPLHLGAFTRNDSTTIRQTLEWILTLFPILAERRGQLAGTLSGGEQQMLAIGRALMSRPRILLLDEPSLGLAPLLVKTIFQTLREINATGVTIVLVEQNARVALKLAHRGYVLETGRIVLEDSASALLANPEVQRAYLGGA
jgi:branched-chain amino acid transport system ATP-binding protein